MISLRTVHCPVDFSPATPRQVDVAADLCRAFGARLVIHHNRHSLGTGASVGWMWNADHRSESVEAAEAKLRECASRLPEGVASELIMTEGPVSRAVTAVSDKVKADLVVLTTHGTHADDHASITEGMLEQARRSVLVLHEPRVETRTPHFASAANDAQVVLAPTDLAPASRGALELGFDLARALTIELHVLHLLRNGRQSDEEALAKMRALVPEDVAGRVKLHVEHGDPGAAIARAADQLSASCIVMGEHPRGWFSRDTSRAVLQQAHCPVWYVPEVPAS
jgi:nucleotide-binding universal stress UspA family protein